MFLKKWSEKWFFTPATGSRNLNFLSLTLNQWTIEVHSKETHDPSATKNENTCSKKNHPSFLRHSTHHSEKYLLYDNLTQSKSTCSIIYFSLMLLCSWINTLWFSVRFSSLLCWFYSKGHQGSVIHEKGAFT